MPPARTALGGALVLGLLLLGAQAAVTGPERVVLDFNNAAQESIRSVGVQNQLSAKLYALVRLAQWQTVQPYVENANQAWQAAAAAYSAHAVLNTLFPWRYARFDAVLKPWVQQTSLTPDQLALARKVGRSVALKLVASRLDDGFAQYRAFVPAPANGPVGAYQFVPAQTSSLYPQLAKARTFVLSNLSAFSASPHTIPSAAYTADLKEVFELGGATSTKRTPAQGDIAKFWVDGNTTSAVTGHWNTAAQILLQTAALAPGAALRVADLAELFARLNVAVWDASIVGWRVKYKSLFWRPVTAIRQGDGTPALKDTAWSSFVNTPGHPEFPSGHSLTSGAAQAVLSSYFGDAVTFTLPTEFPGIAPRTYTSLTQALEEQNDSRVYAGVHFRRASSEGGRLGREVAAAVGQHFRASLAKPAYSG